MYGELDERINAAIPDLTAELQAAGTVHQINIYPDSPHAFHNDTGASYRQQQAVTAFIDTLNWFATHLRLPEPYTAPAMMMTM